jgi:triacylglycerol lipase
VSLFRRLIGLKDLIHDAVLQTTNLVEETHDAAFAKPVKLLTSIEPLEDAVRTVDDARRITTAAVYSAIRATNEGIRLIEDVGVTLAKSAGVEIALEQASRATGSGSLTSVLDAAESALNAAFGDFLEARNNGLGIRMGLRFAGADLPATREALSAAFTAPTNKVCVFVHGLGVTEAAWSFLAKDFHGDAAVNFGTLLAKDLGYTPLYVRYNTGLHVSENGQKLATLLEEVFAAYPLDIMEVVLVGHSMGGLVVRSAAHYGAKSGAAWAKKLRHVFSIGTPHMGAALEKASHVLASVLSYFDTAGTQVPAKIMNARSAGIKDLRFGYVLDEDWRDKKPDAFYEDNRQTAPFVEGVAYYFIASTLTQDPNHPVGQLLGDVLVRLPSAAGFAPDPARAIHFHGGRVIGGAHHLELMNHPEVYAELRRRLDE